MDERHLVLLETAANQRYIFATNKLRENVGASDLTWRAGTEYVLQALRDVGGPALWPVGAASPERLRASLRGYNRTASDQPLVLTATSGKALLVVNGAGTARRLVAAATTRALRDAPGLDLQGVAVAFDWTAEPLHAVVARAHAELDRARSLRSGPEMRFGRLPLVAECRTSGLPAATLEGGEARSAVAGAKRKAAASARSRLRGALARDGETDSTFADSLDDIEKGADWLGLVHADGNGLGRIFLAFHDHIGARDAGDNPRYAQALLRFSLALDEATERAFDGAVAKVGAKPEALLPLVLGGDDLTLLCNGRQALRLTKAFLEEFEDKTRSSPDLKAAAPDGLSACAGVVVCKPHYPFHAAYDLVEDLLRSAKTAPRRLGPCSALDFHVLYDTSAADLQAIHARLSPPGARLFGRPLLVTAPAGGPTEWHERRRFERLEAHVLALRRKGPDGRRHLPSSQMHWLRAGLAVGPDLADQRLGLIRGRYPALAELLPDPATPTLFWEEDWHERGERRRVKVSDLLDAMDASEFLEGRS